MVILYGYIFYYFAAMVGISIGYHRYYSHRSFETSVFFEYIMLFFGMLCGGRSPLTWVAVHRLHHSTSDTEDDPHSPMFIGIWKVITSRWDVKYIPKKHIVDLLRNPRLVFFHKYGRYIHLAFAVAMLLIGFEYFIVFVIMPFIFAYISFGLLNYVGHIDGEPADAPIMNLLAPGEGWHKRHHNDPRAYSLSKYDMAGWVIEKIMAR
jgi:fatty-acid desaturase